MFVGADGDVEPQAVTDPEEARGAGAIEVPGGDVGAAAEELDRLALAAVAGGDEGGQQRLAAAVDDLAQGPDPGEGGGQWLRRRRALDGLGVARPWPLAWLRAAYIRGLCTKSGLPRPTWTSVIRLVLLDVLVGTPLAFAIGGLEKADQAALGAPLLLIVLVFTLYTDYAIVVDELSLWQAFRSSLHVLLRRPSASLGVTAVWLVFSFALAAALGPTFDNGATPLALTALLVLTGVLGFGLDVCLLTLYRATPPPPGSDVD